MAETGYQDLPQLSAELTQALVDHYLAKVDRNTSYRSLNPYFDIMRGKGAVRLRDWTCHLIVI